MHLIQSPALSSGESRIFFRILMWGGGGRVGQKARGLGPPWGFKVGGKKNLVELF